MEAERALEAAKRHSEDAEQANETNKGLRRTIDSLRTQMEESIRVREAMRGKLMGLQEDMALAAREISEENARRAKKEQELIARQEVLDAKLQAEARTRERLELEIQRLENGERDGMRAVSECKRLEALVVELKNESHAAQKDAMRHQREFEEARESGLSEVQRTRHYMQAEIESANNQVNVVREDLENQVSRLRAELDQVKLDADTTREKHEMLLEEANTSKKTLLNDLKFRHANEVEDLQTQHERQLNNTIEDAQRHEQHLLERLSLSSSKTEHLQDRVSHLEDKLEVAKSAANAAAKAARSASTSSLQPAPLQKTVSRAMELPEKISPQALRESIMVLQEQLQDREQTIEKLEQNIASLDPDSAIKISKRDDEILWLRELLSVRKSDLQDIVNTLETEDYDPEQVKDAAIRLRANLQMEEQERERAMNGGSALNLPNIAASLRDAATPRVAQAVGPLAAAWGNWRKGRESSTSDSGRASSATPSRGHPGSQGFLSGLLTPPASNLRQSPLGSGNGGAQPTAFGSTGTRFTAQQLANRPQAMTPRAIEKQPMRGSPRRERVGRGQPATPPMMRRSSYDNDARAEDFSDAGFYDDDESTVDDSMFGVGR
jgi:myosin heavy subunit